MKRADVAELLEGAKAFHDILSERYVEAAKRTNNPKLRSTLRQAAREESHMKACFAAYASQAPPDLLDALLPFEDDLSMHIEVEGVPLKPDMSEEEIVRPSRELSSALVNALQVIREGDIGPARRAIDDLIVIEKYRKISVR